MLGKRDHSVVQTTHWVHRFVPPPFEKPAFSLIGSAKDVLFQECLKPKVNEIVVVIRLARCCSD